MHPFTLLLVFYHLSFLLIFCFHSVYPHNPPSFAVDLFFLWSFPPQLFVSMCSLFASTVCLSNPLFSYRKLLYPLTITTLSFLPLSRFLFPVSYLRLLQALLDVDLASAVVQLGTGPGLVGPRPLKVEDGALYPLGSTGALCLLTTLSGLLLQVVVLVAVGMPVCIYVMLWGAAVAQEEEQLSANRKVVG